MRTWSPGPHYLEAVFDGDGIAQLQGEVDNIRNSLRGWIEDDGPAFEWSGEVPPHLGIAATGSLASPGLVKGLEQTADELLCPPFQLELTATQLTLPRIGHSQS